MYQSLYRKYRPASFDEIVGQEIPVKILQNAIVNNRIAHAYLFAGIRGTGKTSIAKIFAKTVNCVDLNGTAPCNKCVVCTQNNNTDIVEIDAASNNGVDEIRELRDKVSLVPSISKYKVYIIDEVHMLSTSAFNALLKTLEEPPSHAIFILATTEAYKIPLTIISRCQRLDFKPITIDNIIKRMKYICEQEKININDEALYEIALLANGGMRDAISLLEQAWAYTNNITSENVHKINGTLTKDEIKTLFKAIITNNVENCFTLIDLYEKNGIDFVKVTDELLNFARNMVIYESTNILKDNLIYKKEDMDEFKKIIQINKVVEFIKKINISMNEIKTVSNKKTVFEMFIIDYIELDNQPETKVNVQKEVLNYKIDEKLVKKTEAEFEQMNQKHDEFVDAKDEPVKVEKVEDNTDLVEEAKIEEDFDEIQEKIKTIRVDNTLAEFDKRVLKGLESKLESIHEYIIDLQYGSIASMILDGKLKAASKEYMLFVYDEALQSLNFNHKIKEIEELIKIAFKLEYKVISIDADEWEVIKEEFNQKKKNYQKTVEDSTIEQLIIQLSKVSQDFLDESFSDIISYE